MHNHQKNKKIVKNTLALYFRQIIVMGITFFTYRIVLQTLGVIDYGIYNVVGGVVLMFNFLTSTLMGITQRFINVEMENGANEKIQKIFSTSLMLYIILGLIIIIIGQTLGVWFIRNKLVIPAERMPAAMWVFQFALLGFFLSKICAPFQALVIAHEDMHIYGYVGIFEVIIRLIAVYLLVIANADKLIVWAIFGFIVSSVVASYYAFYCRKKYPEAKLSFGYDPSLVKELVRYGGFVFLNNILDISRTQGVNIVLNIFFGPAVNAARGLAYAVDNVLLSFNTNFRQAMNPQLTKSCARNDMGYLWNLYERGVRISFFLILLFSIPFLLKTDFILWLWLKDVPEYTAIFIKLIIIHTLLNALVAGSNVIINATGKLKAYYSINYIYLLLVIIFSFVVCKMGYAPYYVFIIPLPLYLLSIPARFIVMKKQIGFSFTYYINKAFLPILFVSIISFMPFYFINKIFYESNIYSLIFLGASMVWTGFIIICIGLRKNERVVIFNFIKNKLCERKNIPICVL